MKFKSLPPALVNLALTFSSVILVIAAMELFLRLFPEYLPPGARQYMQPPNQEVLRKAIIEFLDESPYVKFKPNVTVEYPVGGSRGTREQFDPQWKADAKGFRNPPHLARLPRVDIVTVGNSFTLGMGVPSDKIWPYLLNRKGYTTYNLGIQGYAPSQMEGTFRRFGLPLKPKIVIIGYTSQMYYRERFFFNKGYAQELKKFLGDMESFAASARPEIRVQTPFALHALYLAARNRYLTRILNEQWKEDLREIDQGLSGRPEERDQETIKRDRFRIYEQEILSVGHRPDRNRLEHLREWKSTLEALSNIDRMARSIGARVILLFFPHRGETYFRKATGLDLPDNFLSKKEARLLAEFSRKRGITFVDLSLPLRTYTDQLPDEAPIDQFPYLPLDGHMSATGHRLIVKELLPHLENPAPVPDPAPAENPPFSGTGSP